MKYIDLAETHTAQFQENAVVVNNNHEKKHLIKAFTLVELLLYVGIITVVLSALITFAWNTIVSGAKNTTQQEIYSQARYISERLKYEIRNANSINIATSNFEVNFASNPNFQLSLAQSAPNDPTIISISSGKALIKQGAAAAVILNSTDSKVTNLTFSNFSSGDNKTKNINFTLTIVSNYSGSAQQYVDDISLQSSAEVRSN